MEKKRLSIVLGLALMASGFGAATAQNGVLLPQYQRPVDVMRGNPSENYYGDRDTIWGAKDIHDVFGAGESAIVTNRKVTWPFTMLKDSVIGQRLENTLPGSSNSLLIGSEYSKNAVVGIYDYDGMATGALREIRFYNQGTGSRDGTNPPNITGKDKNTFYTYEGCGTYSNGSYTSSYTDNVDISDNTGAVPTIYVMFDYIGYEKDKDPGNGIIGNGTITDSYSKRFNTKLTMSAFTVYYPVQDLNDPTKFYLPMYNNTSHGGVGDVDINSFVFYGDEADTIYTSTRDNTMNDDGKPLLIPIEGSHETIDEYEKVSVDYVRPTTVFLSGTNYIDKITVGDVEWYKVYMHGAICNPVDTLFWMFNPGGCCHLSGWTSYYRDDIAFSVLQYKESGKYVDAAVRLADCADVIVCGNVLDSTSHQYSTGTADTEGTDALIVVPGRADSVGNIGNFRLKVGGDFNMLLLQDSGNVDTNNPLYDGYLYSSNTEGTGPGAKFPKKTSGVVDTVYLEEGKQKFEGEYEGMYRGYADDYPRNGSMIYAPDTFTYGSVFGVGGAYNGQAHITTLSRDGRHTKSIVEWGSDVTNQDSFHIYSNAVLKNLTLNPSACSYCGPLNIGTGNSAPKFHISMDYIDTPLYIVSSTKADCCPGGIVFGAEGVESLNNAFNEDGWWWWNNTASGWGWHYYKSYHTGTVHIQSTRGIDLQGSLRLAPPNGRDHDLRLLSDQGYIHGTGDLTFESDTAALTVWARGLAGGDGKRGCKEINACGATTTTSSVMFDGDVKYVQLDSSKASGLDGKLLLIRSDNDDVLIGGKFKFNSSETKDKAGEMMLQAGQDLRIGDSVEIKHYGTRSVLIEAKKTVAFGSAFTANMQDTCDNSDLTIKAGYPKFMQTADVYSPLDWGSGTCVDNGYANRETCQDAGTTGGDIAFGGDVTINVTPHAVDDSVDVFIRAYNTIHIDKGFAYTLDGKSHTEGGPYRDTTMLYAEIGNIESMGSGAADTVKFDISANDSMLLLIQAGNALGNPCGATKCHDENQWDGNILFGKGKPLTVNHKGVGPTLISAARDIENREGSPFTFNYTNKVLSYDGDNLLVTAGRHIEAHAPYTFNFKDAGTGITNDITMRAGHQATGNCDSTLCKATEYASSPDLKDVEDSRKNYFAAGGAGHGSILAYDSVTFNYDGQGTLLMSALNGNIESDPYLHGKGYPGGAPVTFNHGGTGLTRMAAIDIKLHDVLAYNVTASAADLKNGRFQMAAYDSILTRSIRYTNPTDTGSASVTSDKYKSIGNCDGAAYDCATGGPGIHQGHIVLGYGADCGNANTHDSIVFDFAGNTATAGANLYIKAGYEGYAKNKLSGKANADLFKGTYKEEQDKGKGYGGNITFDFLKVTMGQGSKTAGGYAEISTPNGNIWGKDSLQFHGIDGDLLIDAGDGSIEDARAIRWDNPEGEMNGTYQACLGGTAKTLNTSVPSNCDEDAVWRTGNIMLKGGSLNFGDYINGGVAGTGRATIRTREGYIDIYDAFTVDSMKGDLLVYAGTGAASEPENEWADVSFRDFAYNQVQDGGSVFVGADDNVMFNYGNSNGFEPSYKGAGQYDVEATTYSKQKLSEKPNPFYSTSYKKSIDECGSTFDVNANGYLWYKTANEVDASDAWEPRKYHRLYRGCETAAASPLAGECKTSGNGARALAFDYDTDAAGGKVKSGGLGVVAGGYIDFFTEFTFKGGEGSGMGSVPGMETLKGEGVQGYGLYVKSLWDGDSPEKRRVTCFGCGAAGYGCSNNSASDGREWTYIGFHDDARIHAQEKDVLLEAPVIEFFGHAELDEYTAASGSSSSEGAGRMTLRGDSLVFHDSAVFYGAGLQLLPYTADASERGIYHGVVNDALYDGDGKYYRETGAVISMGDRMQPVIEFGYQRCYEPTAGGQEAPNAYSEAGGESTPLVGGDVIVAFKQGFTLPIQNTVVANHARISFMGDYVDGERGGEFRDACVRTDLLRIRNKVEFYTDPDAKAYRFGTLTMVSPQQLNNYYGAGIYARYLHMEPGSELSIPDENTLIVGELTAVGGYGHIHEDVFVKDGGVIAPGFASLMASDCQTGCGQGHLDVHDLTMESGSVLRISIGSERGGGVQTADTIHAHDHIFFSGKTYLRVVSNDEFIEPGCYLFLEYDDTEGVSKQYARNLVLETEYDEETGYYYHLDFSDPGKVFLCVTEMSVPVVQRYIMIHTIDGVTTTPAGNTKHYVAGHKDFSFTAVYADGSPREVTATGYYSNSIVTLPGELQLDGSYLYTIYQVTEPWDITFGDYTHGGVGNEAVAGPRVWAYNGKLFFNVGKSEVASIYTMTGVLYKKMDLPDGSGKATLDRGIYVVTLKDGSVHKIVIE